MAPKPLFLEGIFSQIGRKTDEHLNALRTQLGVDCDPAYDYTEIIERQKSLAKKKAKSSDEEPPVEPAGPMAELQKALQAAEAQQEQVDEAAHRPETPPLVRHRKKVKNDWPFTVQSRDEMYTRLYSRQFKPPPCGTYRPRDVFPDHRPVTKVCSVVAKVFPEHTSESILITKRREEYSMLEKPDPDFWKKPGVSVETKDDYLCSSYGPEKPGHKVKTSSLGKQLPRPSMVAKGMRDPPEGVENIEESKILSTRERQPEWDFSKWKERASPALRPFHCGQYKPNLDMVGPRGDLVGMAFEKQTNRPNPEEGFGRNKPAKPGSEGKSIKVDRSLFRALPGVVSTIPRVPDVDLSKQIDRPGMAKRDPNYFDKTDPKIVAQVRKNEMEIAWQDTFKCVAPANDFAPDFSKALRREQAILGLRVFGADPALMRMRYPKPETSTQLMDVEQVDSQLCRPRVLTKDFNKMAARDPTKLYVDLAARFQEPAPAKFERPLLESESHPNLGALSAGNQRVQEMRMSRSFQALPDWDEFVNSTI